MGIGDHIKRTSVANIVSGAVLLIAAVYCVLHGDLNTLKELALIAAGYLFGSTMPRWGGRNGQQ